MSAGGAPLGFDRRALAKALTQIENREPRSQFLGGASVAPDRAHRVGFTGSPGAGKSSLISALLRAARARGLTVAVLCIDPSSPKSGGALLGDRVRMTEHLLDPGVFVRSFASRGAQGGLSTAAGEAADLLARSGFDLLFLETVGAGQADVDIAYEADTTLVLFSPGAGDVIQAMKSGLMEVADCWVVTKCDQPEAETVRSHLLAALTLLSEDHSIASRLLLTSAQSGVGVSELLDQVLADGTRQRATGGDHERRARRIRRRIERAAAALVREELESEPALRERLVADVACQRQSLEAATQELIRHLAAHPRERKKS